MFFQKNKETSTTGQSGLRPMNFISTDMEEILSSCHRWFKALKSHLETNPNEVVYLNHMGDRIFRHAMAPSIEVRTVDGRWPLREFRNTNKNSLLEGEEEIKIRRETKERIQSNWMHLELPKELKAWMYCLWPSHWIASQYTLSEDLPYTAGIYFASHHIELREEVLPLPYMTLYKGTEEENQKFVKQRIIEEKQYAIRFEEVPVDFFDFLEQIVEREGGFKRYSFLTQLLCHAFSADFLTTVVANRRLLPRVYIDLIEHDMARMFVFAKRMRRVYKSFEVFGDWAPLQWECFLIEQPELALKLVSTYHRFRQPMQPRKNVAAFAQPILAELECFALRQKHAIELNDPTPEAL